MKVFGKIALGLALVLAVCLPVSLAVGCGKKEEEKLSLAQSFKTEYYVGEELDVSDGILKYINDENKTVNVEIKEDMISVFSTEKPGNRKMLLTYEDETLLVDYTVKPWDLRDNTYYSDKTQESEEDSYTFLLFNKSASTVSLSNGPADPANNDTFQATKSFDEDGNIVYTFLVAPEQESGQDTSITYTISNITKDSLKLRALGYELTLTVYEMPA